MPRNRVRRRHMGQIWWKAGGPHGPVLRLQIVAFTPRHTRRWAEDIKADVGKRNRNAWRLQAVVVRLWPGVDKMRSMVALRRQVGTSGAHPLWVPDSDSEETLSWG